MFVSFFFFLRARENIPNRRQRHKDHITTGRIVIIRHGVSTIYTIWEICVTIPQVKLVVKCVFGIFVYRPTCRPTRQTYTPPSPLPPSSSSYSFLFLLLLIIINHHHHRHRHGHDLHHRRLISLSSSSLSSSSPSFSSIIIIIIYHKQKLSRTGSPTVIVKLT